MRTEVKYLTVDELASLLRTTPAVIYRWRWSGDAPPAVKIGKRVLFPADRLDEWLSCREAA